MCVHHDSISHDTVWNCLMHCSMQVRGSAWNFQELLESRIPDYKGRPNRSGAELEKVKAALPKIQFMTTYEFGLCLISEPCCSEIATGLALYLAVAYL